MAYRQNTAEITRRKQQASRPQSQRRQGVEKENPTRRSARLRPRYSDHPTNSTKQTVPEGDDQGQATTSCKRKRDRNLDAEDPPPSKRQRQFSSYPVGEKPSSQEQGTLGGNPIQHYIQIGSWPKAWFEPDGETREHFEGGRSLNALRSMQDYMDLLRPSKKTKTDSLKRSSSSLSITHSVYSDQSPRESKSRQYSTTYELRLQAKGSHMYEYDSHCDADNRKKKEKIKQDCKSLLKRRAKHPQDTLFRDESFQQTCDKIRNRNEAIIVQDISRLIVPSAQNLAILGASRLSDLYETVNEGWNNIYPFEGTRPQPDYAVGFDACAFTQEQHRKLQHHIGQPGSNLLTCFLATPRMYFPFLTCEIKCGNEALDIADRQNAHSMTVAVRAVVLLFSLVKRLPEIHREILGFSISHNDSSVRIYGHYAVIRGENASYYRHTIRRFDFTDSDGLERWTAYDFTRNVYDIWKPLHFQRITSVLDSLPNHRTIGRVPSVSSPSTSFSQQTSNLDSQQLQADVEADGTQMLDLDPVLADMQTIASTTASSQLDGSQNGTSTTALTPKTESQSDAASRLVTQALKPKARKTGGRKSSNSKNPV